MKYQNNENMNILVSANEQYFTPLKTMLFSLKKYNAGVKVFFINQSVSPKKIKRLKKYVENKIGFEFVEIVIDQEVFEGMPLYFDYISKETYSRLYAQFYLPEDVKRILWLDIDVICLKNIEKFYFQDFEGRSIIASVDDYLDTLVDHKKQLGLDDNVKYFNAGIMIMNIEKLRKTTSLSLIKKICAENSHSLKYQDQDLLNVLYQGDVKLESKYYNYQLIWLESIDDDIEDISFLHYCGKEKPWKQECYSPLSSYYWAVENERGIGINESVFKTRQFFYKKLRKIFHKTKGVFTSGE